jgi:hypothetical protein
MFKFRVNKLPKHRRFDYIPRFYDPAGDDFESRLRDAKNKGKGDDLETSKERISRGFRRDARGRSMHVRGQNKKSNYIFLVTLLVLTLFVVYLFIKYMPYIEDLLLQ